MCGSVSLYCAYYRRIGPDYIVQWSKKQARTISFPLSSSVHWEGIGDICANFRWLLSGFGVVRLLPAPVTMSVCECVVLAQHVLLFMHTTHVFGVAFD